MINSHADEDRGKSQQDSVTAERPDSACDSPAANRWPDCARQIRRFRQRFAALLGAGGGAGRRRRGDEIGGQHHAGAERGRNHHLERHQHTGAGDRRQPDFHVALPGEIFDRGTVGDIARDRGEVDGADHGRPLIALRGLDLVQPLEGQPQFIAHSAVEDRGAGLASLGANRIGGARHLQQGSGHRIEHAAALRVGHRDACRILRRLGCNRGTGNIAAGERDSDGLDLLRGLGHRGVIGRYQLAVDDAALCRAAAAAAGNRLQQAGGTAGCGSGIVIVGDLDGPGASTDRNAGQRHLIMGIELALRMHRRRGRAGRCQQKPCRQRTTARMPPPGGTRSELQWRETAQFTILLLGGLSPVPVRPWRRKQSRSITCAEPIGKAGACRRPIAGMHDVGTEYVVYMVEIESEIGMIAPSSGRTDAIGGGRIFATIPASRP